MLKSRTRREYIQVLLKQNGNVCAICGKEIDLSLKFPHDMSISVDHRLPVSLGGPDWLDNLQLTHSICNKTKKTSLADFESTGARFLAFFSRGYTHVIVDVKSEQVVASYFHRDEALNAYGYLNKEFENGS